MIPRVWSRGSDLCCHEGILDSGFALLLGHLLLLGSLMLRFVYIICVLPSLVSFNSVWIVGWFRRGVKDVFRQCKE